MRAASLVPIGLIVVGLALVALAVADGGASLALVVVLPVLYGRSLEFVAGVLLFVAGLFALPLAFGPVAPVEAEPEEDASPSSGGSGGLVLIGPVPILWGSWKGVSPRTRVLLAVVGGAILAAAVVLLLVRAA